MAEMPHMIRREQDEIFCPRCARRWSANEEPPGPCIDSRGDDRAHRQIDKNGAKTS